LGLADADGPAVAFLLAAADVAAADGEGGAAALDPASVAWTLLEAAPEAAFDEPDDPPHAVSNSTSDPSPVAAVHPLLRITSLLHRDDSFPGPEPRYEGAFPGRRTDRPGNA
jgi:hypothetical protein